nr:MAG TPA: hypothetical protein [Bacteriophage sp.]
MNTSGRKPVFLISSHARRINLITPEQMHCQKLRLSECVILRFKGIEI